MKTIREKLIEIIRSADSKFRTVLHAPTERTDDLLMEALNKLGYEWCSGGNYKKGFAKDNYRENQCYLISDGTHSDIAYFKRNGFNIINLEEELFSTMEKKESTVKVNLTRPVGSVTGSLGTKAVFHRFETEGRLITLGLGYLGDDGYGISMSVRDEIDATKFDEEQSLELGRQIVRGRLKKGKLLHNLRTNNVSDFATTYMTVKIAKGYLIETESNIRKEGLKNYIKAKL